MIALAKTTGQAAKLKSQQTTWLGVHSGQKEKSSVLLFLHHIDSTYRSKQHAQTCSQSSSSLSQQVKADMPAGCLQEYGWHVHAAPKLTNQLTEFTDNPARAKTLSLQEHK